MTTPAARIIGIDLARGLALVGMMLVHLGSDAFVEPSLRVADALGGRAAGLFTVLAGVSLALMRHRDPDGTGSAWGVVIRSVLLIGLGLGLAAIPNVGVLVILAYYGFLFLALIWFRDLRARTLFLLALLWAVLAPIVSFAIRARLDPAPIDQVTYTDLADPIAFAERILLTGTYPVLSWLAFGLLGLAIGRLDLRDVRVAAALFCGGGALAAVTVAIAALRAEPGDLTRRWYGNVPTGDWSNLLELGAHSSTPLYLLSVGGSAAAVIGLSLLVVRSPAGEVGTRPLQWIGAMPLTFYTVHVLLVWLSREHQMALGQPGWSEWGWQVVLFALVAMMWRISVGRGPLEAVVHRLGSNLSR